MAERQSCIFLTMPTSGTGSLWRLIAALAGNAYKLIKISEVMENRGESHLLAGWVPNPTGHIYMYNTPHIVNSNFSDPRIKLITNFRDPRDLSCNQFYWALQHPVANKTPEQIEERRRSVAEAGIDAFVANMDNNLLFKSLKALQPRLLGDDSGVLKLSYSQLCLDFDNLVESLILFLGVERETVPWDKVERERTVNLEKNPDWIGQIWTGTDIMPGRYRRELQKDTIAILDNRYRENLRFVRSLEKPSLRRYLATESERPEMERVLVGQADELFLMNDANDTIGQITGKLKMDRSTLIKIAMEHRNRRIFGSTLADFTYGHAMIPSKEVVHRDLLPDAVRFEEYGGRPLMQYLDVGASSIWRPFYEPSVLEKQGENRFFPQTDSHWNHAGAYRYLKAFIAATLPALVAPLDAIPTRRFGAVQQGDLGQKLEIARESIEIVAPARTQSKLVFENGISNEGCIRWYKNDAASIAGRAFVLHDSFTNWLLGVIPELFSETVFFHGTIFDYDFVTRFAPTTVLCIQAERFFTRPPETGGDMRAFVASQEREKNAKNAFAAALKADPRFANSTG
jgi:hypothetical protein